MIGDWWRRIRPARGPAARRWVVIDVETTGLDPRADTLLCVAALAIDLHGSAPRLLGSDSFEAVIRQDTPRASPDNVLLHRIGWDRQRRGEPPRQALEALTAWVADAPLLAYHAGFDREVLRRAYRSSGLGWPHGTWLDMADLLPAAFPDDGPCDLDQWMNRLGIRCVRRHQAIADVWATAELFLKAWPAWQARQLPTWDDLAREANRQRWLRIGRSHRSGRAA